MPCGPMVNFGYFEYLNPKVTTTADCNFFGVRVNDAMDLMTWHDFSWGMFWGCFSFQKDREKRIRRLGVWSNSKRMCAFLVDFVFVEYLYNSLVEKRWVPLNCWNVYDLEMTGARVPWTQSWIIAPFLGVRFSTAEDGACSAEGCHGADSGWSTASIKNLVPTEAGTPKVETMKKIPRFVFSRFSLGSTVLCDFAWLKSYPNLFFWGFGFSVKCKVDSNQQGHLNLSVSNKIPSLKLT